MKKFAYSPAVKEVQNISFSCFGSSNRDEFSITARVQSAYDNEGMDTFVQSYSVSGKFKTAIALYTALAAAFNTDVVDSVVATESGLQVTFKQGLTTTLTAQYVGAEGINEKCQNCDCCEATISVLTKGDEGSGTYEQIQQRVNQWMPWTGSMYTGNPLFTKHPDTDFVVPKDIKATTYYIQWSNSDQPDESHTAAAFNVFQEFMLVLPEGVSATYFEQTTEALLGAKYELVNN